MSKILTNQEIFEKFVEFFPEYKDYIIEMDLQDDPVLSMESVALRQWEKDEENFPIKKWIETINYFSDYLSNDSKYNKNLYWSVSYALESLYLFEDFHDLLIRELKPIVKKMYMSWIEYYKDSKKL